MMDYSTPARYPRSFRTRSEYLWIALLLSLLLSVTARAQQPIPPLTVPTSCSYVGIPATITLTSVDIPLGFSTRYLLVDMTTGLIVSTNPLLPVFTSIDAGLYYAVAAHYTGTLTNAVAGRLITEVYESTGCLTYGPTTGIKVCQSPGACDFASAPANLTFTAANVSADATTTYVLVDEATNLITQTSSTPSFSNVPIGDYAITAITYTSPLIGFAPGNSLYDVTTNYANCSAVSQAIHVRVCNSPITITSPANGATLALFNPPVTGVATPGSNVTILGPNNQVCSTTALPITGLYTCTSLTFVNGPASITAISSDNSTATSSFNVVVVPTVTILTPLNGTIAASFNPLITGTATPGSSVTIAGPNGQVCTTTATLAGLYSCASLTFVNGPASVTAVAADNGVLSNTATSSFNVVVVPTVTILTPLNGTITADFNPLITGTATPGSSVTITGPNGQVCTTTATLAGLYSCASLTFVNGPASITAVAADNGVLSNTATSSFNVVVVPTVTILTPLNGTIAADFNPLITGTATPGSSVTITGPNGQVCTTTATLAGLYSCASLTFVNGPASITAVAADNGVLSNTATSSFNVVVVPTVTILTPLNGSVAADFNPLITGTATPGSSVTITGPNGQVCTTTATLAGLYSCASLTFVNGPASITAVAADNGVLSNTATSSFIIAVIPTVAFTGPAPGSQTTLTPVIEGLATPGSSVTLTDGTAVLCITTADPLTGIFSCPVTLASPGSKTLSAATSIDGLVSLTVTLNFTAISVGGGLTLQAKVLLQGALINSPGSPLMRDDLRVGNYLPLLTPYASLVSPRFAQVGGGGELTTPLVLLANAGTPDAIVDWVLVELRDAANPQTIVATRSALVQRDGDVVVADNGTAPLSFTGLTGSSFYVSIKHRNHLGVMTAAAIPLSTTGTVVDFTTLSATATFDKSTTAISYDGLEMATINGKKALWAGNANHDDRVKYTGLQNDNTAILDDVINAQLLPPPAYNYDLAFGYFFGDLDMDGKVKYQGQTIDPNVIFNNVLSLFLPNATDGQLYNYDLFIEQLP
ncbi:beta strand repeat-containing protein [Spirosoma rigui]|uniref:beta strand repeat-containing protein n=1 Tax=Spirosoma rigui TaxID=564064 RepID=UPI0012D2E1AE|nr:hypothetical protein [Spirosoma rigui]